ncbi:hypothetical protein IJL65_00735 [bacterium]|nr:hypothetical protein [bacterium]
MDNKRSLLEEKIGQYQGKITDEYNEQTNIIRSWIKGEGNIKTLRSEDKERIVNKVTTNMT